MPTDIFFLCMFLGVDQNFHTFVVQGVWLTKIKQTESDWGISFGIWSSEEKPLGVTACINVILKRQIIVLFIDFKSSC